MSRNMTISKLSPEIEKAILEKSLAKGCSVAGRSSIAADPLSKGFEAAKFVLIEEIIEIEPTLLEVVKDDNLDLGDSPILYECDTSVALASLVGGIIGRLALGPLFLGLGANELWGAFASTILGSFAMVLMSIKMGKMSPRIIKWAAAATGGAFLLSLVGIKIPFIKTHRRSFGSLLLLPILALLLILSRRRPTLDMEEVKIRIDLALRSIMSRVNSTIVRPHEGTELDEILPELYSLSSSSSENLEVSVESLLRKVSSLGYEGMKRSSVDVVTQQKQLVWNDGTRERYESFGYCEEGESVIEEVPPVVKDGEVIQKGMVRRKVRL